MIRLSIAAIALAAFGVAAPASAFHPFDETYGYVMPERLKQHTREAKSVAEPELKPAAKAKPKGLAKAKIQNNEDEDTAKPAKPQKKVAAKGPSELDGGGTPNIAPVAPPKVAFPNSYGSGTIVIDTAGRRLYYILSSSSAYQYPIAVGREGFTWTGTEKISKMVEWPDWNPPAEMLERRPELPEHMSGGIRNPLGAVAMYLGNSLYRIHGTNDAKSIGTAASSGCIRMTNGHAVHLASIAGVGTTVRVLAKLPSNLAKAAKSTSDEG